MALKLILVSRFDWRCDAKFRPMLATQGLRAGKNLYCATPAVTQGLCFSGLIRRTPPPFCHALFSIYDTYHVISFTMKCISQYIIMRYMSWYIFFSPFVIHDAVNIMIHCVDKSVTKTITQRIYTTYVHSWSITHVHGF